MLFRSATSRTWLPRHRRRPFRRLSRSVGLGGIDWGAAIIGGDPRLACRRKILSRSAHDRWALLILSVPCLALPAHDRPVGILQCRDHARRGKRVGAAQAFDGGVESLLCER